MFNKPKMITQEINFNIKRTYERKKIPKYMKMEIINHYTKDVIANRNNLEYFNFDHFLELFIVDKTTKPESKKMVLDILSNQDLYIWRKLHKPCKVKTDIQALYKKYDNEKTIKALMVI